MLFRSSLKANEQRTIIEQLLGITMLSERAERIKELNRTTKEDISAEEFRIRAVQEANKRIEEQIESLRKRERLWIAKRDEDVAALQQAIADLEHIDIDAEVQSHRDLESFHAKKKVMDDSLKYLRQIDADDVKQNRLVEKLRTEISALDDHKCHSCGQDLHDSKQEELKEAKEALLKETALQLLANDTQRHEHLALLDELGELGTAPKVFYDTLEDALNHKNSLGTLKTNLVARQEETDPYGEQIEEMQGRALQVVTYDQLNALTRLQEHQEFLLKLLTSKDSFVRKKIIDQNLSYLNSRLTHYLDRIGLPHTVKFQNDLTVSIEELRSEEHTSELQSH